MKLLYDFFPILAFFIAYKTYDLYVATAVLMVVSALQVGIGWLRHRKVEKMHMITLVMVVVFGGLTLALRDPVFIMWKPTGIYWLFAGLFLGSQFVGDKTLSERMLGTQMDPPPEVWSRVNLSCVAFFAALGVLNLYVAFNFSESDWVNFKLFGTTALTFIFMLAVFFYIFSKMPEEEPEDPPNEETEQRAKDDA